MMIFCFNHRKAKEEKERIAKAREELLKEKEKIEHIESVLMEDSDEDVEEDSPNKRKVKKKKFDDFVTPKNVSFFFFSIAYKI